MFYQLFELILTAPIHCRGSIGEQVMQCYISPTLFWWINKPIYILDGLRVNTISANFIFMWTINYSFKYIFPQTPVLTTLWFQLLWDVYIKLT